MQRDDVLRCAELSGGPLLPAHPRPGAAPGPPQLLEHTPAVCRPGALLNLMMRQGIMKLGEGLGTICLYFG